MKEKNKNFVNKILIKLLISMLIIALTSSNFLFCGTYFISYAVDLIQEKNGELDKQTDATLSKNVKFDAYFKKEEGKTHYCVADVNNDEVSIDLKLEVQKEGYLKDIVISMQPKDEQSILNYELKEIKDNEMLVKKQSVNNIYLQQLNEEESASISLSIIPNIKEQTTKKMLNQNSIIRLTGTYINDNGEETSIEKDVTLNIGWTGKYEVKNDIEVSKYLPLNINNEGKVFLQLNVKTGLEEQNNILPIKNTKIEFNIPEFNNIQPEKIDVIARSTQATNGLVDEKVIFTNDNWSKKDNIITIETNNEETDGMLQTGKGLDEYLVTLVYPQEAYDSINDKATDINVGMKTYITIYSNNNEETFSHEESKILKVKEEIGKLLSFEGSTKTDKIGKGKMYANLNSQTKENETMYETSWNINVGYKESLDGIILKDTSDEVINAFGKKIDISKYVTYKSTVVSKASFMQILGEDGRINIKNAEGGLVTFINKLTNQDENGDFIINYYGNVNNLQIETSAPIAEGNLIINNTKAITGSLQLNKTDIEELSNLISTYGLWQKEKNNNKNIQTEEKFVSIPFEETSSKAKLTINKEKLSTLVKNENVEFKIELGNNNDSSDLYVDPMFDIELPSYIEDVEIKDSRVLYDDELIIKSIEKITNSNGNLVIRIQLSGVQTKFSNGTITNGTNIILDTDIKVNILTPSIDDNINMYYYNMNNSNYENMTETEYGKAGLVKTTVSYAAPLGLINVSNWSNFDKTGRQVMSVNQGDVIEQIQVYQSAIISKMNIMVINNTGNVIDGISVLGRIPFIGNKSVLSGEELGTTVNTYLKNHIKANNIDEDKIRIFYSENGEATRDLTNENNGWKENIEDITKVKSFMIFVSDYQMNPGEIIGFSYDLEIPKDITYNNNILSNFATYYTEYAEEISKKNEAESNIVGITTGKGPELAIEQEVVGKNDDGTVNEYGLLKFRVKVSNNGTETANNVVIHDQIPKWTDYVKSTVENNTSKSNTIKYASSNTSKEEMKAWDVVENGDVEKNTTPKLEWKVDKLEPGESVIKEFEVMAQATPGIYEYYRDYNGFMLGEDGRSYITTQTYDVNTDSSIESKNELTTVPDIDITNIATVTASNFAAELKASSDTVTLKKLDINAEEILGVTNSVYAGEGDDISYTISITNAANKGGLTTAFEEEQAKEKIVKNLKIEKHMPEGITYKSAKVTKRNLKDGTEKSLEANYNDNTKTLIINCDELGLKDCISVLIEGKANSLEEGVYEKEISTNTQVSAEGCETIDTNTVSFKVKKPHLYMLINSSSQNQYLTEGEIVEYNVEIKNLSEITATGIQFEYKIPEGLEFVSGTKNIFGIESSVYEDSLGNVMMYGSLKENESATLNIKLKVLALPKDTDISNIFTISGDNVDFEIQTIDQIIEKSANAKPEDDKNNSNNPNGGQTNNKNIKVSGIAWLDSNENGKRDTNEDLLGNIKVMAIDAESGKVAINTEGNEAITTTSSTGSYLLTNLKEGNYLIVFLYDTAVYTVTQYQAKEAGVLLNSDAIEREIVQDGIKNLAGVTDTINLQKSISNIDLGLVTKQKFDLKLEKSVAKVSVQNKEGVKVYEFDNTKLAQVPITGRQLENSTIVVEYRLKVINEGNVAGFAKNIVDYLPKELSFNSELNSNWYVGNDNNLYNTNLAEQVINPGESKELTLVLTKKLNENSTGIINNNAEIKESYNEYGLKDRDSIAGNNTQGEDDQDSADIIVTVRTGGRLIAFSLISIVLLTACAISLVCIRQKRRRG